MERIRRIQIKAFLPYLLILALSSCGGLKYPATPLECVHMDQHARPDELELDEFFISPSGQYLAVGTSRGVALYSTGTLELVWFAPTWHRVYDIAWSPDESLIASSDVSSCIFLWDVATGENVQQLCGHGHEAVRMDWSGRPDRLASGAGSYESRFGELIVWDTKLKEPLHVFKGVFTSQNDLEWSPEGSMFASWSIHGPEIFVRDGESCQVIRKLKMPENVLNVHWSPDGTMLASPAPFYNDQLYIWDPRTGDEITVIKCDVSSMGGEGGAWSADSKKVAVIVAIESGRDFAEKKTVMLWNARTGEKLTQFPGHLFSHSPDGTAIVTVLSDEMLIAWDIQTGQELLRLTGHSGDIGAVSWSGDGEAIVAGTRGRITAWNAHTGELIRTIDGSEIEE
jgi:WD40 repeat protein